MLIRNQIRLILLMLIVGGMGQGCGKLELEAIPENGAVLAFGDSLTVGVGVEKSKSYPSVLAALSGRDVINGGVSGELTADGIERLDHLLANNSVDLLILLEGGNDILQNRNSQQTKHNLAQMIELARAYGADVLLVGVPEKKLLSSVAPFYKELAKEYELVLAADVVGDLLRQPKYKSDSIHFNEAGYRVLAESLYALLQKHGAL